MEGKLVLVNRYNLCEEIANLVLSAKKENTGIFLSRETANLLREKSVSYEVSRVDHKLCRFDFDCRTKKFVDLLTERSRLKHFQCAAYRLKSCEVMFKNNRKKYIDFEEGENETVVIISEE